MKTIFFCSLLVLLALTLRAADPIPNHNDGIRYIASYSFTGLSSSAGALTIAVPAKSPDVFLIGAVIESTVAHTAAQNLNGTVTPGTTVTPTQLNNPSALTTNVAVTRGATVVGGTTLPAVEASLVKSAYRSQVTLEHIALRTSSAAQSYTISTGSITGDATVYLVYAISRK